MRASRYMASAALLLCCGQQAAAADLGGDCCADLEERVAELEATAARKGNRRVSLTVSGHVNEALLFWDDGEESNTYIITNETSRTRFRFVGQAKIDANWSAGYLMEIGVRAARQNRVTQNSDDANTGFDIRHSAWWLQNKQLGKLWLGQTSQATDDITQINLANVRHVATNRLGQWIGSDGGGFFLRKPDGSLSTLQWGDIVGQGPGSNATPGEGDRWNLVKYESPAFAGFTFSASWGEDDLWDVALRYAGEFGGFKISGGAGYESATETERRCAQTAGGHDDCQSLGLSGSVMHIESGLYVHGAYGVKWDDGRKALYGGPVEDEDRFWYAQAGVERTFVPLGKTTVYGEYRRDDVGAHPALLSFADLGGPGARLAGAGIDVWGAGVNQAIDAAAADIYVAYRKFDAGVLTSASGLTTGARDTDIETVHMVMSGLMIRF